MTFMAKDKKHTLPGGLTYLELSVFDEFLSFGFPKEGFQGFSNKIHENYSSRFPEVV